MPNCWQHKVQSPPAHSLRLIGAASCHDRPDIIDSTPRSGIVQWRLTTRSGRQLERYLSQTAACRRTALLLPHQFAVGGDTASVLRAFVWRSSPGFLRLGVTGIHKVTSELET